MLVVVAKLIVDRKVFDPAHAEAEQNALLDPEVDAPLVVVTFGGTHFTGVEPLLEFIEQREVLVGKFSRRVVEELRYAFCQFHPCASSSMS